MTPDHKSVAIETALLLQPYIETWRMSERGIDYQVVADYIEEALSQVRRETLEEAARCADDYYNEVEKAEFAIEIQAGEKIASVIRSLENREGGKEELEND